MATASNHKLVTTKIPMEESRFTWKIANFAKIRCSKKALELQNFRFEMGAKIGLPTKWKCYLQCSIVDGANWIGVYITLDEKWFEKPFRTKGLHLKMALRINDGDDLLLGRQSGMQDMYQTKSFGIQKLIPQSPKGERQLPLQPDRSLCMEVKLNLFNLNSKTVTPDVATTLTDLESHFGTKFQTTLTRNLISMLENPKQLANEGPMKVTLVSGDGQGFCANREILVERSPVFMTMFQASMMESKEGVVHIKDISGKALKILLEYMYAGVLSSNWKEPEVILEITNAAHKYMLEDLQEFLDQALGLACTPANCGALLRLAKQTGMTKAEAELKEVFKRQLKDGSLEDIMQF